MPSTTQTKISPVSVVSAFSSVLRSRGLASAVVIDDHVFFNLRHTPTLHCVPVNIDAPDDVKLRPVALDEDLEDMDLTESVRRFIEAPASIYTQSSEFVRSFLSVWAAQVAGASCDPAIVLDIVDGLLEVEYRLSNDGPGACVLVGRWVVWTAGRHGMSDLHFAMNIGDRPCPDMETVNRWDSISALSSNDLQTLLRGLNQWKESPSVWSFQNREVPQTEVIQPPFQTKPVNTGISSTLVR